MHVVFHSLIILIKVLYFRELCFAREAVADNVDLGHLLETVTFSVDLSHS
jgi:hypothetical protein